MILIADLVGRLNGLETFDPLAAAAHVDEDLATTVQDEAVALVHRGDVERHLTDAHVALSLDLQQLQLHLVRVDVLEAAGHAAVHVAHTCVK